MNAAERQDDVVPEPIVAPVPGKVHPEDSIPRCEAGLAGADAISRQRKNRPVGRSRHLDLRPEVPTMLSDENRVIVEDALCSRCFVPAKQVHHRDFPEIRAACGSIAEGVIHLAEQLSRYREGAPTGWHRELIDRAIAEVADYLDTLPEARQAGESHCRCGARDLDKLASTPAQARSSQ